jgi:hypothetical protein
LHWPDILQCKRARRPFRRAPPLSRAGAPAEAEGRGSAAALPRVNKPRGASALRTLRLYHDETGRVLEASDSVHPGDRFAYSMDLRRGPGS